MLVTGATSGIGTATAEALAEKLAETGSTLIVHGRDQQKLDRLVEDLRSQWSSQSGPENIHGLRADFSSLGEVRAMADQVVDRFGALHVLFNNAGVLTDHRQETQDGFELTFGVNHLAPFLLTQILRDTLLASAPARIATNSSSAMGGGRINFDDLQMTRNFDGWSAYANSKLANMLFSNYLARELAGTQVVSNSFCPGLIDTNLLTGNRDFGAEGVERLRQRMRSAAEGAVTPVFLATAPEAAGMTGAYFLKSHGYGKTPLQVAWDEKIAERLWQVSLKLVSPWLN